MANSPSLCFALGSYSTAMYTHGWSRNCQRGGLPESVISLGASRALPANLQAYHADCKEERLARPLPPDCGPEPVEVRYTVWSAHHALPSIVTDLTQRVRDQRHAIRPVTTPATEDSHAVAVAAADPVLKER